MRVGINCGHTASGPGCGAVGLFPESQHTRIVGRAVMEKLRNAGVEVIDCTIDKQIPVQSTWQLLLPWETDRI